MIGAFTEINQGKVKSPAINAKIEANSIGRYCSIAGGTNIGFVGHSTTFLSSSTLFKFDKNAQQYFCDFLNFRQPKWEKEMADKNIKSWKKPLPTIHNDVWIEGGGAPF